MGVNIRLYLYKSAAPEDFAKAISILAGNPANPQFIDSPEGGFTVARPEYTLTSAGFSFPLGTLNFPAPVDPYSPWHSCTIHLNDGPRDFAWALIPPSTPFWIAMATRLVDLFGGALDYQDCDESECDYFRFERAPDQSDRGFIAFHKKLIELDALTGTEIENCRQFAAYDQEVTSRVALA